jgi:hypothetical protein
LETVELFLGGTSRFIQGIESFILNMDCYKLGHLLDWINDFLGFYIHFVQLGAQFLNRFVAMLYQDNLVIDHVKETMTFLIPGMKRELNSVPLLDYMCNILEKLFGLLIFLQFERK